jgi:hypothetical protein
MSCKELPGGEVWTEHGEHQSTSKQAKMSSYKHTHDIEQQIGA